MASVIDGHNSPRRPPIETSVSDKEEPTGTPSWSPSNCGCFSGVFPESFRLENISEKSIWSNMSPLSGICLKPESEMFPSTSERDKELSLKDKWLLLSDSLPVSKSLDIPGYMRRIAGISFCHLENFTGQIAGSNGSFNTRYF